jgi:hypothetical protein
MFNTKQRRRRNCYQQRPSNQAQHWHETYCLAVDVGTHLHEEHDHVLVAAIRCYMKSRFLSLLVRVVTWSRKAPTEIG